MHDSLNETFLQNNLTIRMQTPYTPTDYMLNTLLLFLNHFEIFLLFLQKMLLSPLLLLLILRRFRNIPILVNILLIQILLLLPLLLHVLMLIPVLVLPLHPVTMYVILIALIFLLLLEIIILIL